MVSPEYRLGNDANRFEGTVDGQIISINRNNVESDGEDTIFGQGGNDLILGLELEICLMKISTNILEYSTPSVN